MQDETVQLDISPVADSEEPKHCELLSDIIRYPLEPVTECLRIFSETLPDRQLHVAMVLGSLLEQADERFCRLAEVLEDHFGEIQMVNDYGRAIFPWAKDLRVYQPGKRKQDRSE